LVSQLIPPLIPPLIPLLMCHRGSPCFPAVIIETPVHAFAASSPNRVGRAAASYSEFFWETVLWVSDANGRARRLCGSLSRRPAPEPGAQRPRRGKPAILASSSSTNGLSKASAA